MESFLDPKVVRAVLAAIPANQFFVVVFRKKDNTLRRMNCRREVISRLKGECKSCKGKGFLKDKLGKCKPCKGTGKAALKPGPSSYNKDLVSVFDTQQDEYRSFDVTRVLYIKGGGQEMRHESLTSEIIFDALGNKVNI